MSEPTRPPSTSTPPHHRPGGGFQNPCLAARAHGTGDGARWMVERWRHGRPANPPSSVFPRANPSFSVPRAATGTLGVTWVGHSTFLVQLGALNVLTDPMWSARASPIPFAGPKRLVD